MLELPQPRFMPCPECGASLPVEGRGPHVCEPERLVDFRVLKLRPELEAFEARFEEYLNTPEGRFEAWYAEHRRAA